VARSFGEFCRFQKQSTIGLVPLKKKSVGWNPLPANALPAASISAV